MKTLIFILALLAMAGCSAQHVDGRFTVYKIITTEDEDKVIFIRNSMVNGIIVMDNDSLKVDSTFKKIELHEKYCMELDQDNKKFRGEPASGYMIISNSGKTQKIWDVKKDGPMPLIFTARNIKGLYIKENCK